MAENKKTNNRKDKGKKQGTPSLTWLYVVIAAALLYFFMTGDGRLSNGQTRKDVSYTQFQQYVSKGYAQRIVANKDNGTVTMYVAPAHIRDVFASNQEMKGRSAVVVAEYPSADKLDEFLEAKRASGEFEADVRYEHDKEGAWWTFLLNMAPMIFLVAVWIFIMRRMSGGSGGARRWRRGGRSWPAPSRR